MGYQKTWMRTTWKQVREGLDVSIKSVSNIHISSEIFIRTYVCMYANLNCDIKGSFILKRVSDLEVLK